MKILKLHYLRYEFFNLPASVFKPCFFILLVFLMLSGALFMVKIFGYGVNFETSGGRTHQTFLYDLQKAVCRYLVRRLHTDGLSFLVY